jgi:hypothetical protein
MGGVFVLQQKWESIHDPRETEWRDVPVVE